MKITIKNPLLGAHMSIAGGVQHAITAGESIGCTAIQIFTASNRQWSFAPIKEDDAQAFIELKSKSSIQFFMSHASYLINLGSPNKEAAKKSSLGLEAEVRRCQQLQIQYTTFHPGACLESTETSCIERIAEQLDIVLEATKNSHVTILLENTAGQGSNVGYNFEQLALIREKTHYKKRVGVCLDTCHLFAAGYDFATKTAYENMWQQFDSIVGREHLCAMHLNDSKKGLNSRVDRHEEIGNGVIGLEAFSLIMNDTRLINIPKILETPTPGEPLKDYSRNLAMLRSLIK